MGACFDYTTLKAENDKDAVTQMGDVIQQSAWENGHGGYSGTLAEARGAHMSNKTFSDFEAAYEWVEDHAEKWGPALGVRVTSEDGDPYYFFGAICSS